MAYNFPVGYQPAQFYYPTQHNAFSTNQNVAPTYPTQQPVNNGIIWVQGEAGAKSYMVAPNTTVQLWDSENQVIYLKSADASGMPSIKTLEYKLREEPQTVFPANPINNMDYATKAELEALRSELEQFKQSMKEGEHDE